MASITSIVPFANTATVTMDNGQVMILNSTSEFMKVYNMVNHESQLRLRKELADLVAYLKQQAVMAHSTAIATLSEKSLAFFKEQQVVNEKLTTAVEEIKASAAKADAAAERRAAEANATAERHATELRGAFAAELRAAFAAAPPTTVKPPFKVMPWMKGTFCKNVDNDGRCPRSDCAFYHPPGTQFTLAATGNRSRPPAPTGGAVVDKAKKPCRFFPKGKCDNGDGCAYSHSA